MMDILDPGTREREPPGQNLISIVTADRRIPAVMDRLPELSGSERAASRV